MGIGFTWTSRDIEHRARTRIVLPAAIAGPKMVFGFSMIIIPSAAESEAFVYLVAGILYGIAAGTTITLGPVFRLSSTALYACFVPFIVSLAVIGWWTQALFIVVFLIIFVPFLLKTLSGFYEELGRMRVALAERAVQAEQDARTDWLTGLYNRQGLYSVSSHLGSSSVGTVYVDLDGFKLLNDTYGHEAGDIALRAVSDCLKRSVRPADIVARIGGDEFVLLVADVTADELAEMSERVRCRLGDLRLEFGLDKVSISSSMGLALDDPGQFNLTTALQVTDAALYAAKRAGRDQAVWSLDINENDSCAIGSEAISQDA